MNDRDLAKAAIPFLQAIADGKRVLQPSKTSLNPEQVVWHCKRVDPHSLTIVDPEPKLNINWDNVPWAEYGYNIVAMDEDGIWSVYASEESISPGSSTWFGFGVLCKSIPSEITKNWNPNNVHWTKTKSERPSKNTYDQAEAKRLIPCVDAGLMHALAEGRLSICGDIVESGEKVIFRRPIDYYSIAKKEPKIDRSKLASFDWVYSTPLASWYAGIGGPPVFSENGDYQWAGESELWLPFWLTKDWDRYDLTDQETFVDLKAERECSPT